MRAKIIVILFLITHYASAQIASPQIDVYGGAALGAGQDKPFWNVNHQYGKYSLDPFEAIAGVNIISSDTSETLIHFDYGLEGYQLVGSNSRSVLHQGYAAVRTPLVAIRAGMKEETIGSQDSSLTLGGTVWSHNARPMPKLVIETPGFVDVPLTKGYLEVNGSLAHGWFEQDRYVKDIFLHQKYLYLRIGGDFMFNASYGIIHFAQWGGVSPNPRFGNLPADWDAYKKVFIVQEGDSGTVDNSEVINKLGNHNGSRQYRVNYNGQALTASIYYQTIFEDGSGFSKDFYEDGIGGVSIKTKEKDKLINHFLFEYLKTTYQSGPLHDSAGIVLRGNDNYFNHYIYNDGWSHHGMTIGSPLITSPLYNKTSRGIKNNRVFALHLGFGGIFNSIPYQTYFTYSTNEGTFDNPFNAKHKQFSWYLEATFPTGFYDVDLNIKLAADVGEMYGNNLGLILMLRKSLF